MIRQIRPCAGMDHISSALINELIGNVEPYNGICPPRTQPRAAPSDYTQLCAIWNSIDVGAVTLFSVGMRVRFTSTGCLEHLRRYDLSLNLAEMHRMARSQRRVPSASGRSMRAFS